MKKQSIQYSPEYASRFTPCFYSGDDFGELDSVYDNRAIAIKLFMEAMKKLDKSEFDAVSAALIITSSWQEERLDGHLTMLNEYMPPSTAYPITTSLMSRFVDVSKPKMTRLLKSAFTKMPELQYLFRDYFVYNIMKSDIEVPPAPDYSDKEVVMGILEKIGQEIKETK